MKIGLQLPWFDPAGGTAAIAPGLAEVAHAADEAGFASIWVMDHFFQIEYMGKAEEPMLEGYSALCYLAAHTKQARLGTLVTGVIYRHPGILVKTVTTLDVLSGGRAYLGIGAGWYEREALGLGVPYPATRERFEQLEETLQIAHRMFNGDPTPYEGKHFRLQEPLNSPAPLSKPRPPILIGGMGEQKTLRFVARYADACNLFARAGNDVLQHKLDLLKGYCEEAGRSYDDIERTTLSTAIFGEGGQSPAEIVADLRALADLGIQHAIFNSPRVFDLKAIEIFRREIIPAVADF